MNKGQGFEFAKWIYEYLMPVLRCQTQNTTSHAGDTSSREVIDETDEFDVTVETTDTASAYETLPSLATAMTSSTDMVMK